MSLCQVQQQQNLMMMALVSKKRMTDMEILKQIQNFENLPNLKRDTFMDEVLPAYTLDDFHNSFRVTRTTFENILKRMHSFPSLKQPNNCPNNLSLEKQILMFLFYLGNMENFKRMAVRFNVSTSTIFNNCEKIASAIVNEMMDDFVVWPKDIDAMNQKSNAFRKLTSLNGIIGAMNAVNIRIVNNDVQKPYNQFSASYYTSIILMAVCDADLYFTFGQCGWMGLERVKRHIEDIEIFESLKKRNFPPGYYLIADSSFPMMPSLMVPYVYNLQQLSKLRKMFNHELNKSRAQIDKAFGQLLGRWRRLQHYNIFKQSLMLKCIKAALVLHNLCIDCQECKVEAFRFRRPNISFKEEGGNGYQYQTRKQLTNSLSLTQNK